MMSFGMVWKVGWLAGRWKGGWWVKAFGRVTQPSHVREVATLAQTPLLAEGDIH